MNNYDKAALEAEVPSFKNSVLATVDVFSETDALEISLFLDEPLYKTLIALIILLMEEQVVYNKETGYWRLADELI